MKDKNNMAPPTFAFENRHILKKKHEGERTSAARVHQKGNKQPKMNDPAPSTDSFQHFFWRARALLSASFSGKNAKYGENLINSRHRGLNRTA